MGCWPINVASISQDISRVVNNPLWNAHEARGRLGKRLQASAYNCALASPAFTTSPVSPRLRYYILLDMSFSALRASARRVNVAASAGRLPRSALRYPAFRKYSTEAPKSSSNTALFGALGVAALGGAAFWAYSSSDSAKEAGTALKSGAQAAKVAANFVPTKEDYQKVRRFVFVYLRLSNNSHDSVGVQPCSGDPRRRC